jgi:hypothetical protein
MKKVTAERFVVNWVEATNNSDGYKGLGKRLQLSRADILKNATRLRKQGVELPRMQFNRAGDVDAEALNSYIAQNTKH